MTKLSGTRFLCTFMLYWPGMHRHAASGRYTPEPLAAYSCAALVPKLGHLPQHLQRPVPALPVTVQFHLQRSGNGLFDLKATQ